MLETDRQNQRHRMEHEHGAMPSEFTDGVAYYRDLIAEHHDAMMRSDVAVVMKLRKRASALAQRLNGDQLGYLVEGAAGSLLIEETKAADGVIPLWGQHGNFIIEVHSMRVRIALDGMLGICSSSMYWPGFSTHIVDKDKPFLSETGYRSFLGLNMAAAPDLTPELFISSVVASYIAETRKSSRRKAQQAS